MATYYVRSGAAGAGTGADWANAFTTLAAAFSGKAAGDDFFVAADHAESQASAMTQTSPGTLTNPCRVICVDHTGTVPPVSADLRTTATISTTGANAITFAGVAYCYGIIFSSGDGATGGSTLIGGWTFKNCSFRLGGTAGTTTIRPGNLAGVRTRWENCTVQFGATTQSFTLSNSGIFDWIGGSLIGSVFPSTLISANTIGSAYFEGVDLSALVAGKTLIGANSSAITLTMVNCKLSASLGTKRTAQTADCEIRLIRTHSAGNYSFEKISYFGDETTETTIVRSGGATDGAQAVAKKIVTTANAKFHCPFRALPIEFWNDVEDVSRTVTVEGIWGGGAVPTNADIWIEVEYLANASDPGGGRVSSAKADVLATAANLTSSAESWGGSTTAFKMSASFTPAQKGPVRVMVMVGKASDTFYICPKVAIS